MRPFDAVRIKANRHSGNKVVVDIGGATMTGGIKDFGDFARKVKHVHNRIMRAAPPAEVNERQLFTRAERRALREASGSVNKYDVRRAEEAWKDADAMAQSYEEDGDPRARKEREKADALKKDLEALKARWEKQKARSRSYSRARSGAMASVGMKRSRYGGWE